MSVSLLALPSSPASALRGILHMLAAVLVFSISNLLVKWATATYPVGEIGFFRSISGLLPCALMMAGAGGPRLMRPRRLRSHIFRGGVGVVSMLTIYYAYWALPLAEATALSFSSPLFMTALSVPLLGERVGVYRWSAVVVGFVGVLIITRPGGAVFNFGALSALMSALSYAVAMLLVRQMSRTEHPITIVFYFHLIGAVVTGLSLPFDWRTPDWGGLAVLVGAGLAGGFGQYFQTEAFRTAPAALLAPFNYGNIVLAGVFGYLVWGEVPGWNLWLGGTVVIASGLVILYREAVRHGQAAGAVMAAPAAGRSVEDEVEQDDEGQRDAQ